MNYISKNGTPIEVGMLIEFYVKDTWDIEKGQEGSRYCERVAELGEDGKITTDNKQRSSWYNHEPLKRIDPSEATVIQEYKMNPEYRTSLVKALCQSMLENDNYEAMPILADALEDAGCHEDSILVDLRRASGHWIEKRRIINMIYSEETANAVRWIEDFAREWNFHQFDYDYPGGYYDRTTDEWVENTDRGPNPKAFKEIIVDAMTPEGWLTASGRDLHGGGELGEDQDKFWENLEIFTGKKFGQGHREEFGWSCSC
ncbi:hypothetical protein C4577_03090 [Candidatus Parcubacteria bacterium]|nr:MAG: hypothetical protein C4577_03090 [Candidatus Parcubacteria bacterium]